MLVGVDGEVRATAVVTEVVTLAYSYCWDSNSLETLGGIYPNL